MSNLLPVGTRVKIVGPDCAGSKVGVGSISKITKSDSSPITNWPYKVDYRWFPATSIQEIKEQTVKIENETQAKAARDYIAAKEQWHKLMEQDKPELSSLRAALAAYESRDKVKEIAEGLVDGDKNILIVMTQKMAGNRLFGDGLAKSREYCDAVEKLQSFATPLALEVAAYLRSQKRELKWEWEVVGKWPYPFMKDSFYGCTKKANAEWLRGKAMESFDSATWTIREVK